MRQFRVEGGQAGKREWLAAARVLAVALGVGACGGTDDSGGSNSPEPKVTAQSIYSMTSATVCAGLSDGRVYCWGDNSSNLLGVQTDEICPVNGGSPCSTKPLLVGIGELLTCGCRRNEAGEVICWGPNRFDPSVPKSEPLPDNWAVAWLQEAEELYSSANAVCIRRADRSVACTGLAASGAQVPILEITGVEDALDIAVGVTHACALMPDHSVSCWGLGDAPALGQCGGTTACPAAPTAVATLGSIQAIAAGHMWTCALESSGSVYCWGLNSNGITGSVGGQACGGGANAGPCRPKPTLIPSLSDAVRITGHNGAACAWRQDGSIACWGAVGPSAGFGPISGQLSATVDGLYFATDPVGLTWLQAPAALTVPGGSLCAIEASGLVSCVGHDAFGQVGVVADDVCEWGNYSAGQCVAEPVTLTFE